jgi:hypothetical protein
MMNVADRELEITVHTDENGRVVAYDESSSHQAPHSHARLLLAGGVLGIVGVAFVLAAPELGVASAVGGALAGIGSAGMTLLARK